ncbi:hypothetical protein GRI34_06480 [Erythrobacter aquimaris]|uniref:Tryptophan-rich sensory protein n=1 Tax=Qipengyuania aquimaris TaxID=255984 RepID=A0A6I4TLV6_9SPHN|nr:hypothetical protein [Qipengyuania aquimaris]
MTIRSQNPVSQRSAWQRIAIIVAVALQIGSTFLPSLGVGEPIGSRSDAERTLITPAGWAFAIWGPLYFGSVVFAAYQALPSQKTNALLGKIGWYAAAAFFGNGLWALYTQLNRLDAVSVLIIASVLSCLLVIYRTFVRLDREFTVAERWIVMLPLSALAAWLTAATIVNVSAALQTYGVGGPWPEATVGAAIVAIGGIIASLAIWRGRGNPVYALVFLWALFAIYSAGGQAAPSIAYATIAAGLLVILATAYKLRLSENRRRWFG